MPLSVDLLGLHPGFRGVSVDRGISATPDAVAPYVPVCSLLFETLHDFMEAVSLHVAALRAGMPNYTGIEPIFQVSEVVTNRRSPAMDGN